ncbi:hypothetical protein [Novosphingobium sp. Gsoil 351]|uniref:hypothetical protein n=1 Tax=Novosphingobium sp. Gsoil 351 TaxID=2675225 RepID=UPI0012B4BC30|nr:hypothetical protein [Novosphingobium sp. Gsoil 351]QGN53999.1 hypothetical protein GKE62_05040 [Novosphingobium sp. Gsoil 351]
MLEQLRFVRIPIASLGEASGDMLDVVGLELAECLEQRARFRSDSRAYSVELDASGTIGPPTVAISLRTVEQLEGVSEPLVSCGWSVEKITREVCRDRRYYAGLACRDLSGNRIELVVRAEDKGRRYFPSRDAGVVGLSHVVLGSRSPTAEAAAWTNVLGARITDRVGAGVYLGWDDAHHRIMFVPSDRESFLVVGFEVESIDAVMQSNYFFLDRQVGIFRGPGREPASGQVFLTFGGPSPGIYFSYSTKSEPYSETRRPRQFSATPDSYCSWGSVTALAELGGAAS